MGVSNGSFIAARREILSVRKVPFSASYERLLSVYIGDNRRWDSINQRPRSAHNCRSEMKHLGPYRARGGYPSLFVGS